MSVAGNEIGLHSEDTNWNEIDFTFEEIGLNDDLVNGIYVNGINKMTPLQYRSLMASITKHDFIIRSADVSEMRVCMSMVVLRLTEARSEQCQSVILVSSHDAALEMAKYVLSLGEFMSVKCSVCTALTNIAEDLREIRDGVHSIIGTPGRVYDLLAIAAFDTSLVKTLVVVDVDDIFSNGYKQCVTRIITLTHCSKLLMCARSDQDMSDAMKLFPKIPIEIIAGNNTVLQSVNTSETETLRDDSGDRLSVSTVNGSSSAVSSPVSSKHKFSSPNEFSVEEFARLCKNGFDVMIPLQPKHMTSNIVAQLVVGTVKTDINKCQIVIICCSRQRSEDIFAVIGALKIIKGVNCVVFQCNDEIEENKLLSNSHVVIGTPDCVLANKSSFLGDSCWLKQVFFVDIDNKGCGNTKEFYSALELMPSSVQIIFSTSPQSQEAYNFLQAVVKKKVEQLRIAENVFIAVTTDEDKFESLCKILKTIDVRTVISCFSRSVVDSVSSRLKKNHNLNVVKVHEDVTKCVAEQTVELFRTKFIKTLVSTQVFTEKFRAFAIPLIINFNPLQLKKLVVNRQPEETGYKASVHFVRIQI